MHTCTSPLSNNRHHHRTDDPTRPSMHIRGVDRRELRGTPLMFTVFAHRAVTPPTQLNIIRELNMEPHVDLFQQRADAQLRLKVNYINQGKYLIQKTLIIFTQTRLGKLNPKLCLFPHQLLSPEDLSCVEVTRRSCFGWQLSSCSDAAPPKHSY